MKKHILVFCVLFVLNTGGQSFLETDKTTEEVYKAPFNALLENSGSNKPSGGKTQIELQLQYNWFDSRLGLKNSYGSHLNVHLVKEKLSRQRPGDVMILSAQETDSPLHKIVPSVFIGLTSTRTKNDNENKETVRINTYEIGLGGLIAADEKNNENWRINIGLSGGLQRYRGTNPDDTGPFLSVKIGAQRNLSRAVSLGFNVGEEVVWTKANQNHTHAVNNFSAGLSLRFKW